MPTIAESIYQLTSVELADGPDADGAFGTFSRDLGVFSSIGRAEDAIRRYVASRHGAPWAFVLKERILDDAEPHGAFGRVSEFRSIRTYLADGTLNAENPCDDTGEKRWRGRDSRTIRFKVGDLVSVLDGDRVKPALIGDTPVTTDRFAPASPGWEAEDDCYLAFVADLGHDHPFTPFVFPLVGQVSDEIRRRLESARDEWAND